MRVVFVHVLDLTDAGIIREYPAFPSVNFVDASKGKDLDSLTITQHDQGLGPSTLSISQKCGISILLSSLQ